MASIQLIEPVETGRHARPQDIADPPISLAVFLVEFDETENQTLKIAGWSRKACVKILVTNIAESCRQVS